MQPDAGFDSEQGGGPIEAVDNHEQAHGRQSSGGQLVNTWIAPRVRGPQYLRRVRPVLPCKGVIDGSVAATLHRRDAQKEDPLCNLPACDHWEMCATLLELGINLA